MNFEQAFIRVKAINWVLPDLVKDEGQTYQEIEHLSYRFIGRFVCFFKSVGFDKENVPLPYKFSPQKNFADESLFTFNEMKKLDEFFSQISSWNKVYCRSFLEWKKMCDKNHPITENYTDLYDDLIKAIELGGIIRPYKGNLLVTETVYSLLNWPNPFYDKCDLS